MKKFTNQRYPPSWKNMYAKVRYKAIEIANAMKEEGKMKEDAIIPIATKQAKQWAKNRDIKVFKKEKSDQ